MKIKNTKERIDLIRRESGLTQQQFSVELGVSQAAVSKYLTGRIPPAEVLLRIARLGKTTVEWLLSGEKNYFSSNDNIIAADSSELYDAEHKLVQKIAALPPKTREAINILIDELSLTK